MLSCPALSSIMTGWKRRYVKPAYHGPGTSSLNKGGIGRLKVRNGLNRVSGIGAVVSGLDNKAVVS